MAPLDRNTRRLIERLKSRIIVLTALVVALAIALVIMTILYISKGTDKPSDNVSSANNAQINSEKDITASANATSSDIQNENETTSTGSDATSTSSKTSSNTGTSSNKVSSESESTAANATLGDDSSSWNLKLVNGKNPLPKGFSLKTEKIKSAYAGYSDMLYDAKAISYLNSMCAAAAKDGVKLVVISSYRTNARQQTLFNNQVEKQRKKYPNLSEEELKKKASTVSAYPGTSEHELGLAVDFNSVEESFEKTAQFQWLKAHAAEYGFVMRYAKEKQSITGVIYEPWHYRFVGEKHAKKMNELGYCLEEYIDYLNKQGK